MGNAILLGGRSADVQEFCFQTPIRSDMGCDEQQGVLLADCQEGRIVAAKRSDKSKRFDLLMLRIRFLCVR